MVNLHPSIRDLPIRYRLTYAYFSSLIIALLVALASLVGLFFPERIYPTEELLQTFMPNDLVNLFFGLPFLLGSMWLAWRGKLVGLLFWPGTLLYVLYNYIAYTYGVPYNTLLVVYLMLIALSAYTVFGLVSGIDGAAVKEALAGAIAERAGAAVLAGLGLLFTLRNLGVITGITGGAPVSDIQAGVLVADFMLLPAWIASGILLWHREPLGFVAGAALLFQACSLFIGLILFMILGPIFGGAPLVLVDVSVVFALGLVCFIPMALFLRGIIAKS